MFVVQVRRFANGSDHDVITNPRVAIDDGLFDPGVATDAQQGQPELLVFRDRFRALIVVCLPTTPPG